jgi:hypothetical protein
MLMVRFRAKLLTSRCRGELGLLEHTFVIILRIFIGSAGNVISRSYGCGSGCIRLSVCRHISNDHLLCRIIPKIVDAQTPPRVSRISAVLDVPVGGVLPALPPNLELVSTRRRISNPRFKYAVAQAALTAVEPAIAILVGKPQQASRRELYLFKHRLPHTTPCLRREDHTTH